MIYCFFTYRQDAALVRSAIQSVRQADTTAKIAVFDDAADPIDSNLSVEYYKRTEFRRNGNLNGLDCVKGILGCFIEACTQLNENNVCKLDSDTFLVKQPPQHDVFWGAELTANLLAHGSCYTITKPTAESILVDLNSREWINGKWPEDQSISHRAVLKGGVVAPLSDKYIIQGNSWASDAQIQEWVAWTKTPNATAIHFGSLNTSTITKEHIAGKMMDFLIGLAVAPIQ